MTDLPPLGVPRRPGSAPRAEVLDAVVRRGRQRVRRAAIGGTAVVVTIAAGVIGGTMLGAGVGSVVLVPASPEPDGDHEETPNGPESTASGITSPAAAPGPLAMSPQRDEPADVSTPPGVTGAGSPAATPPPAPGARPYRESPGKSTSTSCDVEDVVSGTPPGTRVCARASVSDANVPAGGHVDVTAELCNSFSSTRAYEVEFASGREHDVVVEYGGEPVWTWSRSYTFPQGPHTRSVEPGYCLAWVTRWETRDDGGRVVDPGVYYLQASIEIDGDPRRFTVRVDITE